MNNGEFWHLKHVSDAGLRRELSVLLTSEGRTEARIVAHLAEVERRKLHALDGYSCLFKYCQLQLGLSESQAFFRITAARLASRYPIVFGMLEQRTIHLAGLCELRDFLTAENHRELLGLAAGKSTREVKELLAARYPGQVVPDSVRRLPARRMAPSIGSLPQAQPTQIARGELAAPVLGFDPITGEIQEAASSAASPEPAADVRYRIQFDAGSALKAKLDFAQALSSHSNPGGDLAMLFERALDSYIDQLQKRRFGRVVRPRAKKSGPYGERELGIRLRAGQNASPKASERPTREPREHLSLDTRREVVARDGLQCAYVSPDGRRCDEQAFLQFHHLDPKGRKGSDAPSNLRVFCAGHNRFQAERDYGARHIEQRVAESRRYQRENDRVQREDGAG